MSVGAFAATCVTNTWDFDSVGQCGSGNSGVNFTQNGETITILPELEKSGVIQSPNPVDGLFEVAQGQGGNIASGIGPYVDGEGGSPYTSQLGIQEQAPYDAALYIEVSESSIPNNTTLSFLMQEGYTADTFTVYTETGTSTSVPGTASMGTGTTYAVGGTAGSVTTPQFSVKTDWTAPNQVEFIAIKADCEYLLLNSITAKTPSGVPEPRFYGLLLASLLGLAGTVYQKRRAAQVNA